MNDTDSLSHALLLQADRDYEKAARAARLLYVTDSMPGILRLKKGSGFYYISWVRKP